MIEVKDDARYPPPPPKRDSEGNIIPRWKLYRWPPSPPPPKRYR